MANKKEISVQINVGANLEDVQKRLAGLQNKLDKLSLPASVRNEFLGLFSAMDRELEKISQKTAGGKLKLIDSASVGKSIEKIDSLYSALIQKFESRGIATAALKQDQNAISAITSALKVYADSTKSILSEEKKLTAEVQKQERAKEALLEKHKEQKVVSDAELAAQKERVSAATKEANAKAKAVTAARQALEEKIASSGGKYKLSDIDEKGSPLRKTKAYKEYKAATEASGAANKIKKSEADKFASMATFEQQKKDIQEVELRITKAKDRLQEFNNTQKATKEIEAFEEVKRQLAELENIDLSKYGINLAEIKNIEQLEEALKKVRIAAQNSAEAFGQEYAQEMRDAGASTNRLEKDVKDATDAVEDLDERTSQINAMQERVKSFLGISGAAQVMRAALRDAMQTITELDATMTEMAVVTDLSVGDYWNQLPQYSKQASELGVSINSAYKAATLYYQQGLKSNEVTKISAETLKMARIAGLSAEDATNKMTAALRGFNMELNETSAQRVSDVYSELAAITASDVDEISSAMTKTASIASSAGMEFETTAAFLSQIIETTRESAETAGTALKTVIARFQELKKDPAEIGEVDGEIVDANKIETALRSVGVALRDSSGQFRDLDDVFLELSRKWNTLDTNTQRYIATIAAGSRQQSRFIAMMSDYGRTQELVTAANSSAGASNKQFEKTLDSLESKLAKLENAWHEFTMGILESDLVKFGVDMLTKFLEIINKATSALDGVGNSITKIIGILAIFKLGQKIFDSLKQPIFNLFSDVANEAGNKGYLAGKNWAKEAERGAKEYLAESEGKKEEPEEKEQPSSKKITLKEQWNRSTKAREEYSAEKEKLAQLKKSGGSKKERTQALDAARHNGQYIEEAEKNLEDYNKQEQKVLKASQKAWSETGKAIGQAGQGITTVGVGISLLGGVLQSLGLEEFGEGVAKAGQMVTILGSALSAIPAIMKLIELAAGAMGVTVSAAFWYITLIVAAVVVLAGVISAIVSDIQKNSPEGKLKAAQEAADAAADAADRATESYNDLNNSLTELGNKYEVLNDLTRGTSEWKDAVQDINQEVMDLVDKYPELAEFLTSKNGVLTLDLDDEKLQNIVIEAQTVAVAAQNASNIAKGEVARYQAQVDAKNYIKDQTSQVYSMTYEKEYEENLVQGQEMINQGVQMGAYDNPAGLLGAYIGNWLGSMISAGITAETEKEKVQEVLELGGTDKENIARALAENVVYQGKDGQYKISKGQEELAESLGITEDYLKEIQPLLEQYDGDLRSLGNIIVENEKAQKAAFKASAENTKALINLSDKLKPEQKGQAWGYIDALLDENDYERYYNEELENVKTENLSNRQIQDIIKSVFGDDASWEDGKVTDIAGTILAEDIGLNYIYSVEANRRASERFKTAGESAFGLVDIVKRLSNDNQISDATIERIFSDKSGGLLTQEDLAQITQSGLLEAAGNYWKNFTDEQRELFGEDEKKFIEYLQGVVDGANEQFSSSVDLLVEKGLAGSNFSGVNASAAHALAKIAASDTMTNDEASTFLTEFNKIMTSKDLAEDQKAQFSQLVAAMSEDPTNRENWEQIIQLLEESGLNLTSAIGKQISLFISNSANNSGSRYSDAHLKKMGVSDNLISHYQNAEGKELERFHKTFKKWEEDYAIANDDAAKTEDALIKQVVDALARNQEKSVEAQEEVANAITDANDKMLSLVSKKIEEDRQNRENEKAEGELNSKRNRLAYLMQDTSGANALEILNLQKEIAEGEQDFQESLIDQSLQKLEDANEKAAEQRERQIEVARDQLEAYQNGNKIVQDAKNYIEQAKKALIDGEDVENTALGQLLSPDRFISAFEESEFWNGLRTALSKLIGQDVEGDLLKKYRTDAQNSIQDNHITDLNDSRIKDVYSDYVLEMTQKGLKNSVVAFEEFIETLIAQTISKPKPSLGGFVKVPIVQVIKTDEVLGPHFATGGLADFTGPAWLDGTKSRPEYILNAAQTKSFFSLVDVLESLDKGDHAEKERGGDNHFDIEINIEKLENDYDVEQMANKIRSLIYEDATYRNVNVVGLVR